MMKNILFYRFAEEFGFLSNFAPYPIELDGKIWPTTEHYFQAQKFLDAEIQEQFRNTVSPMEVAKKGRSRALPLRPDWEEMKIEVMTRALLAKFNQHADIRQRLLDTGDAILIEHTKNDSYWADNGDGTGRNMLGKLLMDVRRTLKD